MSRIIAGSRGGRRIAGPPSAGTRPTSARVREALFSAISSWAGTVSRDPSAALRGLAFCDLYAGSGAVGLEAASRGADPVWLVERHRRTAASATRNAADLGLAIKVVTGAVEEVIRRPAPREFDVVFVDPPYELSDPSVDEVLVSLETFGWIGADALLVAERARSSTLAWPASVTSGWVRRYGETVLHFGVTRT